MWDRTRSGCRCPRTARRRRGLRPHPGSGARRPRRPPPDRPAKTVVAPQGEPGAHQARGREDAGEVANVDRKAPLGAPVRAVRGEPEQGEIGEARQLRAEGPGRGQVLRDPRQPRVERHVVDRLAGEGQHQRRKEHARGEHRQGSAEKDQGPASDRGRHAAQALVQPPRDPARHPRLPPLVIIEVNSRPRKPLRRCSGRRALDFQRQQE